MKNEMTLELLRNQLKNFGLNPAEWNISRLQALNFLVQNRNDETFALYGRLEYRNRKPQWKSLEVYSL
ncbi:hypothetical protein AZI87_14735 [Bdellovibrio bacteriovorus]|uniref:Uncharacterized protein n=1 Tax=Bdellovibrio bacteriovorus TaxID=959 RepID=A0A161PPL6_BDEBC|nr:hypothetical protein [Bdellovibrio bacteriovorus]KYG62556.1 hypothetical protein AZI87_14735 [Bdellovibrio bacteriovorus]